MRTTILICIAAVFISLNSFAQNGNSIVLNRTYKGRVVEDYNTPDSGSWKDKIIFKNNKIYFKVFSKNWGFPYAPCTISVDSNSNVITFTSEVVQNGYGDRRILNGTITGKTIEGFVQIDRYDHVKRPYSFSGKIK